MHGAHGRCAAGSARRRCASGRSCRRRCTPRRVSERSRRILSASIAAEVSAFLIAKVPPKPQQVSALGQLHQVRPRTWRNNSQRLVADAQHAQRMAGGVVGDPVRVVGADVA